ncbi:hypothetical protein DENSPDRAFT_828525 [Dentipellis sp. KUC8613]|nr:hypothetical protein DENSPDRAFT_828525 [Dentipellis sp. KUC8613]
MDGPEPFDRLPCANALNCTRDGTLACTSCRLVSYCSKDCQVKHWKLHKKDCKDSLRSESWKPLWILENRSPSFITDDAADDNLWPQSQDLAFMIGKHLWGNVPATDIVNLINNENDTNVDLSLVFAASGDLRNVMKTVNALPADYSGQLTILVNDIDPYTVARNLAILLILGQVSDENMAVDVALHLWYSAFVPVQHPLVVLSILAPFLRRHRADQHFFEVLGQNSVLSAIIPPDTMVLLAALVSSDHDAQDIMKEMQNMRFAPSRVDLHHRYYCRLKPSNRLAVHQFRRFGLVLPFGARNNEFNRPNRFLFSPDGRWLQNDHASPLESWNLEEIIKTGNAHGASSEDIFGCLYFFLSDQLRTFTQRLKRFRINFHLLNQNATTLPRDIRSGALASIVPKDMVFDRIDVSNIIDVEYVGLSSVLQGWGPMLKKTQTATILGYFMNWMVRQKGGQPDTAGFEKLRQLTRQMAKQSGLYPKLSPGSPNKELLRITSAVTIDYLAVLYDNSQPFEEFLAAQGIAASLRKTDLKRKKKHAIVAHRICAPLGAPQSALPVFPTDESWYFQVQMGHWHGSERYVEFCRK